MCIGQEYAAAQMLVTCAAIMYGFNVALKIDPKTGKKMEVSVHNSTPHVIPVMDDFELEFRSRSDLHVQRMKEMLAKSKVNN